MQGLWRLQQDGRDLWKLQYKKEKNFFFLINKKNKEKKTLYKNEKICIRSNGQLWSVLCTYEALPHFLIM